MLSFRTDARQQVLLGYYRYFGYLSLLFHGVWMLAAVDPYAIFAGRAIPWRLLIALGSIRNTLAELLTGFLAGAYIVVSLLFLLSLPGGRYASYETLRRRPGKPAPSGRAFRILCWVLAPLSWAAGRAAVGMLPEAAVTTGWDFWRPLFGPRLFSPAGLLLLVHLGLVCCLLYRLPPRKRRAPMV